MSKLLLAGMLLAGTAVAASDTEHLPPTVQAALQVRQVPEDSLSVYVQDMDSGTVILRWNEATARNPASSIKLLTTLVALDVLGPAYSWKTDVYVLGDVQDGRLKGDLLFKGYGDPYLVTERVWQLLRRIRQLGIREIEGDLLIDDSYFYLPDSDPAEFDRQPLRAYNVTPNAMLMNFKVVRYWFEPEFDTNSVRVWLDPPLENLGIDNRLALAAGSCRGYQRGITISANEAIDRMTFSGKFPDGCKQYAMDRTALSHNEFVYGLFISLWRESGGTFKGGWRSTIVDADIEPILSFSSLPLADIITFVNKHSNNVMARQLLLTLSAEVLGAPGTEEGGREVVTDWLVDHGLDVPQLSFTNGAGLSRDTRISAGDMAALLEFAWRQPYMPEFVSSMSLLGHDGTTRRRFDNPGLDGSAHLKTGSLDHVTAIAGYLQAKSGRRFAVVSMQNYQDIHRGPGQEVQEALLRWVYDH
ncbi:MAG: D-alanyl-D-alanine carboxypeptidase/D-alanyl-D-alanine-endopeptidase [Gammaproteobacteria bacterium]|nr:D-alanyl-D-alanine carboxypeptidase/D-alanyl-D-alanine-endopeptidase [Gammaproteobacteria bacterium]